MGSSGVPSQVPNTVRHPPSFRELPIDLLIMVQAIEELGLLIALFICKSGS